MEAYEWQGSSLVLREDAVPIDGQGTTPSKSGNETLRITERKNELTSQLDNVGPAGIVRLLRQTDAQLFNGWNNYPCIRDADILSGELPTSCFTDDRPVMEELSTLVWQRLKENIAGTANHCFIFSGCGTSGRIAWLCARAFNKILLSRFPDAKECFKYTLAGGDESLVISNELPEVLEPCCSHADKICAG